MSITTSMEKTTKKEARISTGVKGLDEIMLGGMLPGNSYLLRGGPGTGKTTIGLQFLKEGAARGEPALFISLEESEEQIRATALKLGFDVSGVTFLDLSPDSGFFVEVQSYDIFSSAEVEREPVTQRIVAEVERIHPRRVFLDPLTQFRYLATDRFQFHRQVLSLFRYLNDSGATILVTSESNPETPDYDVQFLAHAIIDLVNENDIRTVSVKKYRNSDYLPGTHSYRLTSGGAVIYPKLNPKEYSAKFARIALTTGLAELDKLTGGGIVSGTVSMISGPAGVGKTTLGMQIASANAARGEGAVVFTFEEEPDMILTRCDSVNIPARAQIENETLKLLKIEPMLYSADQFALIVRSMVEETGVKFVMIDSISGYNLAIRNERLIDHLHVLCRYLQNMGVTVLLITELSNVTGEFRVTENGISYLADNIIFMRYLEMQGEMKKAIGVLKQRLSDFEKTLREFEITGKGLVIGQPLTNLRGILRGEPEFIK
jgi:circadian clock protein KaiC